MNLISCQDLLIMSWICWCNFSPFPKDFQLQVSQVQVWYSSDHWLVLLQGWQMSTRQRRCWMTMQRVVLCATCGLTLSLTSFSPISFSHKILILDELRPEDPQPDKHQSDKHQSDAQPNKLQSQDSHLWWAEVWGSWAWQAPVWQAPVWRSAQQASVTRLSSLMSWGLRILSLTSKSGSSFEGTLSPCRWMV